MREKENGYGLSSKLLSVRTSDLAESVDLI